MVRKSRIAQASNFIILLTDDDAAYLETTRTLLERDGHTVLVASSGEEALEVVARSHVDLLLLDFYMDGMTGEEVVSQLRKTHPLLQVILQTGYASEQPPRELLRRLEIQGYHDKSEGPDKLLIWVDVGLKAAYSSQLVQKSHQGLRFILDATPELHRLQPLEGLLQGVICQVAGLFGVANSFLASRAIDTGAQPDGFLAMREDEANLVIHAATGRFVRNDTLPAGELEPELAGSLREVMATHQTVVSDEATMIPLCVGAEAIGAIFLDRAVRGEQNLELLSVFANQAAVAIRNSQLFSMASVDPLTGVHVRRFVENWTLGEIRKAVRQGVALTLLMVDMDGLKRINDEGGHLAGDAALARMGAMLRSTLRESDLAGRYGGDEFIVVLPATGQEGAQIVVQRLLALMATATVQSHGREFAVKGSIGVATLPSAPPGVSAVGPLGKGYFDSVYQLLVERADAALYDAKHHGKHAMSEAGECAWPPVESSGG